MFLLCVYTCLCLHFHDPYMHSLGLLCTKNWHMGTCSHEVCIGVHLIGWAYCDSNSWREVETYIVLIILPLS